MKRTFVVLTGATIALGWLAISPDASAHGRYYGQYNYYYGGPRSGSPMYAPYRPAPQRYNNLGRRDFSAWIAKLNLASTTLGGSRCPALSCALTIKRAQMFASPQPGVPPCEA
jgi:hypothetical protein